MSFKDDIRDDIKEVFLEEEEFADVHKVNGKFMTILIDDFELLKREKYKTENTNAGTSIKRGLVYVKAADYGRLPNSGKRIEIDQIPFEVESAVNEYGVYSIKLKAVKA